MKKSNKNHGNDKEKLECKRVLFCLPLREFLKLRPDFYFLLPLEMDVDDPGYMIRYCFLPGGGFEFEIGREGDTWVME